MKYKLNQYRPEGTQAERYRPKGTQAERYRPEWTQSKHFYIAELLRFYEFVTNNISFVEPSQKTLFLKSLEKLNNEKNISEECYLHFKKILSSGQEVSRDDKSLINTKRKSQIQEKEDQPITKIKRSEQSEIDFRNKLRLLDISLMRGKWMNVSQDEMTRRVMEFYSYIKYNLSFLDHQEKEFYLTSLKNNQDKISKEEYKYLLSFWEEKDEEVEEDDEKEEEEEEEEDIYTKDIKDDKKVFEPLTIKYSKYHNLIHNQTGFVIDFKYKLQVIGKEGDKGQILPLTEKDIEECKKYNLKYPDIYQSFYKQFMNIPKDDWKKVYSLIQDYPLSYSLFKSRSEKEKFQKMKEILGV